ncbi:hypothetical protein, partial [Odoribacter splanchnicus]|uniref:hypothetical protein n=1 Tax=Odoribacter splanchnicus TaxID=28118 RepID=UPI0019602855
HRFFSCSEKQKILLFSRLFEELTDRWNSSQARQTLPVGRSEKARRHLPELQWFPNTNTGDEQVPE